MSKTIFKNEEFSECAETSNLDEDGLLSMYCGIFVSSTS